MIPDLPNAASPALSRARLPQQHLDEPPPTSRVVREHFEDVMDPFSGVF